MESVLLSNDVPAPVSNLDPGSSGGGDGCEMAGGYSAVGGRKLLTNVEAAVEKEKGRVIVSWLI